MTTPWHDALAAAELLAVDPAGIGGVRLRSAAGLPREAWFEHARCGLDGAAAVRRMPGHADEGRLLGGIDLAATLRGGRPVAETGLLAACDGGVLSVLMAERLAPATAALIASVLDSGEVRVERDGFSARAPARLAVVACDEGIEPDERPPAALLDRLALWVDLNGIGCSQLSQATPRSGAAQVAAARRRLSGIVCGAGESRALCEACAALGIDSLRVPLLALRVARAAAALAGASEVRPEDLALAARLVLAPRATTAPAPDDSAPPPASDDPPHGDTAPEDSDRTAPQDAPLADIVLQAALAALPADLLAQLSAQPQRRGAASSGRTGVLSASRHRGRPVGTRRGELRRGARLHVLETLRAAAPWQPLRRGGLRPAAGAGAGAGAATRRLDVRPQDFRVVRFKQRSQTTVVFAVDASGSAAMHRLAEAKGAVELFLADCYRRRDQVALVAFRGRQAELVLAPTRSLARARRCLAGVPGGGGTPVASGLQLAAAVADAARRRGEVPLLVVLTDGKANVALDGQPGRERAGEDARAMARIVRSQALDTLLVDFSPRPQPEAERLARELGARYLPLPYADATRLAGAVQAVRREAG